jgi:hypothetical protein
MDLVNPADSATCFFSALLLSKLLHALTPALLSALQAAMEAVAVYYGHHLTIQTSFSSQEC